MRSLIVSLAILLAARSAFAQPAVALMPPGMVEPQPAPAPTGSKKSVATAMWLSLGTTLAGFGLVAAQDAMNANSSGGGGSQLAGGIGSIAFLVGPTLGHAYAGHTWNLGLGIRLGSLAVSAVGVFALMGCFTENAQHPGGYGGSSGGSDGCTLGMIGLVGGSVGFLTGTVVEIATVPSAVDRANREHGWVPQLSIAPMRTTTGVTPGLALGARF